MSFVAMYASLEVVLPFLPPSGKPILVRQLGFATTLRRFESGSRKGGAGQGVL
jgi:hypothetical protein